MQSSLSSTTLNWPGRSVWSAGIFSTIGLDQGIGEDVLVICIHTSCILYYIYIYTHDMNRCYMEKKKKESKSCHHLEISHFPVFWGSCTAWPVPPPVATCSQDAAADDAVAEYSEYRASIITDFLKNSGERKTQKMSKKKVQISSKQPTLPSMNARTCSDPLWVTDLRDSR